ncbi:unnamed protein product [Cuscuta campestris]|uniref:HAT C-terminal dimerisation domain-containing protein n=1 Tax=Cuscuta campestris TaxID=132261 RepID=A0A484N1A2_9ASTE|nr:unnamed protein product [Cuscuta campestris]
MSGSATVVCGDLANWRSSIFIGYLGLPKQAKLEPGERKQRSVNLPSSYVLNHHSIAYSPSSEIRNPHSIDTLWRDFSKGNFHLYKKIKVIVDLQMEEYVDLDHPRRRTGKTNLVRYRIELFYVIIDQQVASLNDRFNEVNMELLHCVACLSPRDSFHNFDVAKLVRLSQFYPNDFSEVHAKELQNQLETYIMDVTSDDKFSNLNGLGDLSTVLVETKKHTTFPLVYKLLKLSLVLPVATAGVERCFSAMNLVKTYLRNRIGDEFFSDCLLSYVEKDMLERVENEIVIDRFQKMKTRRGQL